MVPPLRARCAQNRCRIRPHRHVLSRRTHRVHDLGFLREGRPHNPRNKGTRLPPHRIHTCRLHLAPVPTVRARPRIPAGHRGHSIHVRNHRKTEGFPHNASRNRELLRMVCLVFRNVPVRQGRTAYVDSVRYAYDGPLPSACSRSIRGHNT